MPLGDLTRMRVGHDSRGFSPSWYIVMAYIVMAYIVMACIMLACIAMAYMSVRAMTREASRRAGKLLPSPCLRDILVFTVNI